MRHKTLIWMLAGFILLSPLPFGSVSRGFTPVFYICLLLISLFALVRTDKKTQFPLWPWLRLGILALFGLAIFQVIPLPWFLLKTLSPHTAKVIALLRGGSLPAFHSISLVPIETIFQIFRWFAWFFFFYAMIRIQFDKREINTLFNLILVSGAIQLLIAFLKLAGQNRFFFVFFYPNMKTDLFLTGTIANSGHFAFYLELIFPIAVTMFLSRLLFYQPGETIVQKLLRTIDTNKSILWYLLLAVVSGAGIFLSGSRAGIMASLLALIMFIQMSIYLRVPFPVRRKIRYILIAVTVLSILVGVQNTLNKFLSQSTMEISRFTYWSNSLKLLKDFPLFGSGFSTYKFSYYLYDTLQQGWLTHAHNEYVETLTEGGIFGLLIILGIGFIVFFGLFRAWLSRNHPEVKALGLGVLIAISAGALHMIFEFALRIPANSFLLILLIILGGQIISYKQRGEYGAP